MVIIDFILKEPYDYILINNLKPEIAQDTVELQKITSKRKLNVKIKNVSYEKLPETTLMKIQLDKVLHIDVEYALKIYFMRGPMEQGPEKVGFYSDFYELLNGTSRYVYESLLSKNLTCF